ncbi:DM13 domain-containing protein [Capilliphycus salinus ALCB114379]|uniref:DM13 domain-containing protein n=1 Tax=Capilliphycus salinus TaxID=2768948 RepID=UPI0039A682D0
MKRYLFWGVSCSCFSFFFANSWALTEPLTVQKNQVQLVQTSGNLVSSGTFVSGEHETKGTARIINENGKRYLELGNDFSTFNMGPDLVVILHRSEDVIGSTEPPAYGLNEGDYVIIAPLQEFSGTQRYEIPDNINLEDYPSAGIWCRRFNATFGAARLSGR